MPLTLQPFVLGKNTSLTLVKTADIGTILEEEYICQLTEATLTPGSSTTGGSSLETFCNTFPIDGNSTAAWTLEIGGFQQFQSAQDFSLMAFNNEGEKYTYTLMPDAKGTGVIGSDNPGFTGELTMVATVIGGTAKTHAVFTVSLPCVQKPTMVIV